MEDKGSKGIAFVIVLLTIAIFVICGMGYYIYTSRINENQEIVELRAELKTLKEQNQNYQIALDNINKTLDNLRGNKETTDTAKTTEQNTTTNNTAVTNKVSE